MPSRHPLFDVARAARLAGLTLAEVERHWTAAHEKAGRPPPPLATQPRQVRTAIAAIYAGSWVARTGRSFE
jgi:hypothetical protein